MAQYKVLQDIEAEDKLVGPLSLRQFIYAAIVVVQGFIAFQLATKIHPLLVLPFVLPMIFFGLLAAPFGQNQSSEIWLLAKIRYFVFPRKRKWDQDGIQELVHINVPKKLEEHLTKDFSQQEVNSRLQALANTLDTRGWAIKNISTDTFQRMAATAPSTNDRLVDVQALPKDVAFADEPTTTVLDPDNPLVQKMDALIQHSDQEHRQELLEHMHEIAAANPVPTPPVQATPQTVAQPDVPQTPSIPPNLVPAARPQPPVAPAAPFTPQPILHNDGAPIHAPQPQAQPPAIQAPIQASIKAPANPSEPVTTTSSTGILEDVKNKGRTSITVSHDDSQESDENKEVVISLH